MTQAELDFTIGPPATDVPPCTLCGRTRRWNPYRNEYQRYCGGSTCTATYRPCKACGNPFMVGVNGAGTRYCSDECKATGYPRPTKTRPTCLWCGQGAPDASARKKNYLCNQCLEPVARVIGRLRRHHVPLDMWRALRADPTCQICNIEIVTPVLDKRGHYRVPLVVDHDHRCCPGETSCGKCVRGLLCELCNHLLGQARENQEILESAAAYLRTANLRGHNA